MVRKSERGEGNLGCLIWLLIFAAVGMVLYKALPIKIANTELYDYMVELTKFGTKGTAEDLKKRILIKAKELNLPVEAKNVQVEKTKERMILRCKYTVLMELPGYTYVWEVNHEVDRPIFYL